MGGHSAWRKRVAAGEPAKGSGGAILRHRPHFGRKGEDLKLNRKGNIAGGNPKKAKTKTNTKKAREKVVVGEEEKIPASLFRDAFLLVSIVLVTTALAFAIRYLTKFE